MLKIAMGRNVIGATVVAAVGAFAMWEGWGYGLGDLRRMEAGFFPFCLGAMLLILSPIIYLEKASDGPEEQERATPIALLAIPGSMIAFMLLVGKLGIVIAVAATIAISASADRSLKPATIGLLALAGSLGSAVLFVYLLELPLNAFWW